MKRIVCIRWKSDDCKLQIENCKLKSLNHCRRFSPIVGVESADNESILLDITGLAHLFGGEAALCEAIVGDFSRLGLAARVAVADTIGAAWAAARYRMKGEGGRGEGETGRQGDREIGRLGERRCNNISLSPCLPLSLSFLIIPTSEGPGVSGALATGGPAAAGGNGAIAG